MKRINKTIGIIGCGNMGSAILNGLLHSQIAHPNRICVHDSLISKAKSVSKKFGVHRAKSNLELVRRSEIILLAVKPQDLDSVGKEMRPHLHSKHVIVSILAGIPIKALDRAFGRRVAIVRAMPNLGAQVGEGMTAITSRNRAALKAASVIFCGCGKAVELPEKYFNLVTAVSGSGPAYFFLMMELLAKRAERGGIPRTSAKLLATQTALGAAHLAVISAHSPKELRKMVTSKKGTTEAALKVLFAKGFPKIFSQAINRAVRRARELSQS
ncbi:MAG: pyrroline-5-carboxylate reductase [Candidatus Omnitrophica bacterium]|nr:pyrroline-5-carboxylate reductase [Candidatus Omnitrophota bacterium]